jgi:hypothetical protein
MVDDTITYTCVDTAVGFQTPLGTFSCIVYNHIEKLDEDVLAKHDIYEYYSIRVGRVGTVTFDFYETTGKRYTNTVEILDATNINY